MLDIDGLTVAYPGGAVALRGVSFSAEAGKITTVLGGNGAGKTTLLRAIGGLLPEYRAVVTGGTITLDGERTDHLPPWTLVNSGIAQVLEGRHIFTDLSVAENLLVGGGKQSRQQYAEALERTYALFPVLKDKASTSAGYLSGGEQQMLAIARATMILPRLLLLDEPSLGLAPLMMERIAEVISEISALGVTVLLVEQNARLALSISDDAVIFSTGKVVMRCKASEVIDDEVLSAAYLGGTPVAS
jgi:branched-chain amino acid transport system ATP-binding protein